MRYQFEDCELDTEQYQLYREGRPVLLRRKAFDLLVYLVKHADHTLEKGDLVENVWPKRVISDATLNSSIREVRQAIGDSGTEQRLIKTLYGKGYRFVGNITVIDRVELIGSEKDSKHDVRIPCPYPGMVPFRSEHVSHFYGREVEIAQMVGLLRHQRFMMVIGPSGSGKSSLVQAGLLPELARSHHFAEGYWLVRRMRPGPSPSAVLGRIFDTEVTAEGPDIESVDRLLGAHPPARRLLLLIDQFEEAFAQAEREETARFIRALRGLRTWENLALVLTLRADFYPDLMTSHLWPVDASQRVELAPLRGDSLRDAIVQPAADVGVQIEPSLVERLFADAADEPGVLPMLQETMRLLWDKVEDRVLPFTAYDRLNLYPAVGASGVHGATGLAAGMAMKADATLAELTQEQQAMVRRTFLRLVQFGEGRADTRRQQPLSTLHAAADDPALFERTLEHLTDHRLLTRTSVGDRESTVVDIAHESLITGWSRFREWTEERREAEQVRRRLEGRAVEWERLGHGTGGLLDEAELPEAKRWLAGADARDLGYSEALPELIRSSQTALEQAECEREDARQRELAQAQSLADTQARAASGLRRLSTVLAGVFVVALVAAALAWWQGEKAQTLAEQESMARQEAEARRHESEQARTQAEHLRAGSIAQLLLTLAPEQQAIHEHERSALMARQAYLLGGDAPGLVRDLADRVIRSVLRAPGFGPNLVSEVDTVALSPDGRMLVASSRADNKKGHLLLWDLDDHGAPPKVLPGPTDNYFFALSFSPDGKAIAAGNKEGVVLLWDLERPNDPPSILAEHGAAAWSLVFSPDGQHIAVGAKQADTVWLLDLADPDAGIIVGSVEVPADDIAPLEAAEGIPVAFSPDGKTLASGTYGGSVMLWDVSAPTKPIVEYRGHEGPVWSLAFSPDGRRLASGGDDATARVWDLRDDGAPPRVLRGLEQRVTSLAFRPDNESLALGSSDKVRYTLRLWGLSRPDDRAVVIHQGVGFNNLAFGPDGMRLVVSDYGANGLRLLDLRPSGRPRVLPGDYGYSHQLAFSPDDRSLASAMIKEVIQMWDLNDLTAPPTVLRGHLGIVKGVAFSPDGRMLSSTGDDRTVRLWRLSDRVEEIAVLQADDDPWIAPFSPDGKTLAIAGWDDDEDTGAVKLWDLSDLEAEPVVVLTEMKRWINEIAFSPDGRKLVATGREGIIHLEDLEKPGVGAQTLRGHDGMIWSVAFSPDGARLASGGRDRTVRLWDLTVPGTPSSVLGRHDNDVVKVRFSPNGKYLASSSNDESIHLWDLSRPDTSPALLYGQEDRVWALAFSSDSRILASGGGDKGVLLWDLTHPVNTAPLEQLVDLICEKVWRNLTIEEWRKFVSEDMPYQRTCPNLPADPSVAGDG